MSWVTETKQRQTDLHAERQRRNQVLSELSRVFIAQLREQIAEQVPELNREYPDKFGGRLRFIDSVGSGIDVWCANEPVLTVSLLDASHILNVIRVVPVGRLQTLKARTDHYYLKLDSDENLHIESKDGLPVPIEHAAQELLSFLIADHS